MRIQTQLNSYESSYESWYGLPAASLIIWSIVVKYVDGRRAFLGQICVGSLWATSKMSFAQGDRGAPFAKVPAEYEQQLAKLRSPLLFQDGSSVKSPEDWQRRRREILADWARITGAWPALVEKPVVDVLDTVVRDNIEQRRVRVQVALDRNCDGYILVPKGPGPFSCCVRSVLRR